MSLGLPLHLQFERFECKYLLSEVQGTDDSHIEGIKILFRSLLIRDPTDEEMSRYAKLLEDGEADWQDVIWVIVNSAEFATRH